MNILVKGRVANSYQLIGVFAAKEYLSEKYDANVTLNISYAQYWNKKNIPSELENMLDFTEERKEYDRICEVKVNHNYRVWSNNIITVDDGVGAYRKDLLKSYKTIKKENNYNNKQPLSLFGKIKILAMYLVTQLASMYPKNHMSIFKKGFFNYFEVNKQNVSYFKKAVSFLVKETGLEVQLNNDAVIYLTQPASLVWGSEIEYKRFLEAFLKHLRVKHKSSVIYFKLHPVDDFDYSYLNVNIISSEIPAEFVFSSNSSHIDAVYGINSTSMLTAKVMYGIDAYSVDLESLDNLDFWAKKAFLKYTIKSDIVFS